MKLKFLQTFAQLKIAIFLLLLIAGFSIVGTIIEQDQTIEYYKINYSNYSLPGNILFWQFISFLGLDHIYKTWWFLTLIFLFGTCLITCTFTQQFPLLKFARRCNFKNKTREFTRYDYYTSLRNIYFFRCLNDFKIKNYHIFHQKKLVYCYKGILGRFAPIIVHISLLLILTGNTVAALGSFNAQELIAKGEIFQIQNTITKNYLTYIPVEPIRINDFWIEYGPNKNIKQFYSDLSILNKNGKELVRKTISVNFPLRFKNLTFYQTDWNAIGLRLKIDEKIYQIPLSSLSKTKNIWVTWIPITNETGLTFITNTMNGQFAMYNESGIFLGNFNIGDKINALKELTIFEIMTETGLQIKADPGIPLIYSGFAILMLSSLISYFSFTQFWLAQKAKTFLIGATANRAKLDLRFEFLSLTLPYLEKRNKN
jgi:cytochrome c biogenesis protein